MANDTTTVQVSWKSENGQAKGRITRDAAGRSKIVFVDDRFRGRQPKQGEVTEVEIVKDTKPGEKGKGALIVRPIFAKPANTLTEAQAEAEMIKVIKAGKFLSFGYIDVDLPGWKGRLEGSRPKRQSERGPYYLNWKFEGEDGLRLYLHEPGGHQIGIVVTTGIRVGEGFTHVSNWAQAVKDLGEPAEITGEESFRKSVKWLSESGGSIEVDLKEEVARVAGYTIHNVQVGPTGYVTGDVHLLDGRWVIKDEWFGTPERMGVDGEIMSANFANMKFAMSDVTRKQVAKLLQLSLHSKEWHRQYLMSRLLNAKSPDTTTVWAKIRELESKLLDPLYPAEKLQNELRWAGEVYTRTFDDLAKVARAVPTVVGAREPAIYGGVDIADDSTEVQRLIAENKAKVEQAQVTMTELVAKVEAQAKKFVSQDTMLTALGVFDGLKTRLNTAIQEYEQKGESAQWLTYELETVEKKIDQLQDPANCNAVFLDALHRIRNQIEEKLKPR